MARLAMQPQQLILLSLVDGFPVHEVIVTHGGGEGGPQIDIYSTGSALFCCTWLFFSGYTIADAPDMLICQADKAFFFQAEDGIRDLTVTGVQTCALPI